MMDDQETEIPEPAFVVWHGGNYEVFPNIDEAGHELMAMGSRGLRGWSTTDFQEILDDVTQPYAARFMRRCTGIDGLESWLLMVDERVQYTLSVQHQDYNALKLRSHRTPERSISLSDLKKVVGEILDPAYKMREALKAVAKIIEEGGNTARIGDKLMDLAPQVREALRKEGA
jgi:hypothetical protein